MMCFVSIENSEGKWEHTEEVNFYNLETGCVQSMGRLELSISPVIDT